MSDTHEVYKSEKDNFVIAKRDDGFYELGLIKNNALFLVGKLEHLEELAEIIDMCVIDQATEDDPDEIPF